MHHGAVKIGCPVWAHAPWVGSFFTARARREDFLPQYARVFGTAEGNATFYGLPAPATVARWADEAPETFRFCFKFPRTISHDARLAEGSPGAGDGPEVRAFAERLAPLGARFGPRLLQLPSSFGPAGLGALRLWLARARKTLDRVSPVGAEPIAVEVRHPEFFAGGAAEDELHAALREAGAERCVFDTTGLFAARLAPDDHAAHDAVRKKPRVPARRVALGRHPLVRFVGDPDLARNDPALDRWAATLAGWIDEGREPYFFAHHVDDKHAPELGRRLHARLHALRPERVPAPPAWPCELAAAAQPAGSAQLELF
jgi:uncharacterized protein YecE (DUF72 family)